MPHFRTWDDIYYDYQGTEEEDTFDFSAMKPDPKSAGGVDQQDFNLWQQNFGTGNTEAAELQGAITLLDPSLCEEPGTLDLFDCSTTSDGDLII